MSTSEIRNQDSAAIIITGGDAEAINDTPDREGPLIEYDRYGEPTGYNYVWCPVRKAKVLGGETSTTSYRPAYRYE